MDIRFPSLNQVTLAGIVTADPEFTAVGNSGARLCKFSIAVNRNIFHKETGEWEQKASFFEVTTWNESADRMAKVLRKASPVIVSGELQQDRWETPEGQKRSKVVVNARTVQCLTKTGGSPEAQKPQASYPGEEQYYADDIPF